MKNAQLVASMTMAFNFGIYNHAWDLHEKVGLRPEALADKLQPFVAPALEMYDIAEGVRMGDCSDVKKPFREFAKWFAVFIKENHKLPEDGPAIEALSQCIFAAFFLGMTNEQDTVLKARLAAEVKEYEE